MNSSLIRHTKIGHRLFFAFLLLATHPAWAQSADEIYQRIYKNDNCAPLLSVVRQRAESGDAVAQHQLGFIYTNGWCGTKQDAAQAFKWYSAGAAQNNAAAEQEVGRGYQFGLGVNTDMKQAVAW